jgi:hypothetical protein
VDPEKSSWIEIALTDEKGKAVPGEQYLIEAPDGTEVTGTLGSEGIARVEGIDPGTCAISFPNLDSRSWRKK